MLVLLFIWRDASTTANKFELLLVCFYRKGRWERGLASPLPAALRMCCQSKFDMVWLVCCSTKAWLRILKNNAKNHAPCLKSICMISSLNTIRYICRISDRSMYQNPVSFENKKHDILPCFSLCGICLILIKLNKLKNLKQRFSAITAKYPQNIGKHM